VGDDRVSDIRRLLIQRLWAGKDPLANVDLDEARVDMQGWGFDHPYLTDLIEEIRPRLVVEVGVWKGASTLVMADRMRRLGLPSAVLAVDTWLGSWDIWLQPAWFEHLRFDGGYPTLYRTFCANVVKSGLADYIVPLPLDALSAAELVGKLGLHPIDLVHIDAGHDFGAVVSCLAAWWPLIGAGGALIGDDYMTEAAAFPDVARAFDGFFGRERIVARPPKCVVRK
jgi:predicted O-methyltransferase YrrM